MPEDENGKKISGREYQARWLAGEDPPTKKKREDEEAAAKKKKEQSKAIKREISALKYRGFPQPVGSTGSSMDVGEAKANTASQMEECDNRLEEIAKTKEEISTSIGICAQINESTDSDNASNAVDLLAEATRELEESYNHVSRAKEELEELLLKLNRL
jgi:methyl-accepting chemotaxis protein